MDPKMSADTLYLERGSKSNFSPSKNHFGWFSPLKYSIQWDFSPQRFDSMVFISQRFDSTVFPLKDSIP